MGNHLGLLSSPLQNYLQELPLEKGFKDWLTLGHQFKEQKHISSKIHWSWVNVTDVVAVPFAHSKHEIAKRFFSTH